MPLDVVFGPRGSGKSVYLAWLIRNRAVVVVIDPMSEHGDMGAVTYSAAELCEWILGWESRGGELHAVLQTGVESEVEEALSASLLLTGGVVAIDECEIFVGSNPLPGAIELIERGRHYDVDLVLATRRPYSLWRNATANASSIVVFRTTEPRDVSYIEDYISIPPRADGKKVALGQVISHRLERYTALEYDPLISKAKIVHADPPSTGGSLPQEQQPDGDTENDNDSDVRDSESL